MPVAGGAGKMRIVTGTPLCNPTPLASTGRWTVVSKRKARSRNEEYLIQAIILTKNKHEGKYFVPLVLQNLECGDSTTHRGDYCSWKDTFQAGEVAKRELRRQASRRNLMAAGWADRLAHRAGAAG